SWCAPCRGFVPTMRKYYKEFKDKGVEFIAVSFDDDKIKWEDAMNSLKMEWKQGIVEGGFGANSPVKNMFQIKSIPHIVVIGKDGKIAETLDFYTKEKLPELLTKLTS
ncbi:MAG TPA: thioredoxin family protein, partial [Parasegetibacter sp.]